MESKSRRDFLRKTSSGALAVTAASYARVLGANERIHLGLIGAGNRGNHVMSLFQNKAEVQVVAICDVYGQAVESTRQKAQGAAGFNDYRKLLDAKPLDAVLIATPDHTHHNLTGLHPTYNCRHFPSTPMHANLL